MKKVSYAFFIGWWRYLTKCQIFPLKDYQDRSEGDLEFSRDDTLYSLLEVKLGLTNEVNIESVNRSSVSKPLSPVRSVMNNKKIYDVTVDTEVSSFEQKYGR